MKVYPITPMGKPRITRSTKFSGNAKRYYAWRDQARLLNILVPPAGALVVFVVPMPESWSGAKRARMNKKKHEQAPDVDNMIKALLDAAYSDDRQVSSILAAKVWGLEGEIRVVQHAFIFENVMRRAGLID